MKKQKHFSGNIVIGAAVGTLLAIILVASNADNSGKTALITDNSSATTTPTSTPDSNELNNAQNNLKQSRENYTNRNNEKNNFNFKNKVDLTSLNSLMSQWSDLLQKMESALTNNDLNTFNQLNSDFNNFSTGINDAFSNIYGQSSLIDAKDQALKEKPRQYKDLESQLKNLKRDSRKIQPPIDTSTLEKNLVELQGILTQMQNAANSNTTTDPQDASNIIWDFNKDFDSLANDFRNTINDLNQTVNSKNNLENAKNNLKDKTRSLKDAENDIKRLSKQISAEKLSEIQTATDKMKGFLTQIQTAIDSGDADTAQFLDRDFWDANTDARDIINDLNETANKASRGKDIERNLKEKTSRIKDMNRECKRNKCENTSGGKQLKELENLLTQMQEVYKSGDYESFWQLNSDFDNSSNDFWEANKEIGDQKNTTSSLKDITRELKDKKRWINDLARESKEKNASFGEEEMSKLQSIYDQMEDAAKRAKSSYDGNNAEDAQDILNSEFNELRSEFEGITNDLNGKRESNYFDFELVGIEKELIDGENTIKELLEKGSITEEKASLCQGYVEQGYKFFEELNQLKDSGDVGGKNELNVRFEELGNKADKDCGDVFNNDEKNYQDYTQHFVRDDLQGVADEIFSRLSEKLDNQIMNRVLDQLGKHTSTINSMIEQAGQKWQKQLESAFESISFVDESYQEALLNQKNRLLEQVKGMDEAISKKTKELEDLQNKIAGYNFFGEAGNEIQDKLEEFVTESSGLSESQIKAKIKQLEKDTEESIKKAREEKFNEGVIPFRDTDDNDWFTRYVADAAENGIVKGYTDASGNSTGQFRPEGFVTVGEILKMALESSGAGQSEEEPSQGSDHWARGYVKQAENLGLSIVKGKVDLNRPASRSEVVRIILEAAKVEPEAVSESSFVDVGNDNTNAGHIEKARNLGIISGDGTKNTFRPNDKINRAETAKMISNSRKLVNQSAVD